MAIILFNKIYLKENFYLKIINIFYTYFRKINLIIKHVILWIYFLHSLLKSDKKNFLLHSISPHYLTRFFYEKVDFVKNAEKKIKPLSNNYSIIIINFNSVLMLKFLIFFLKVFYNLKKSKFISSTLINKTIYKKKNLLIKNNFDVHNRNLFLKRNFFLPNTSKDYKLYFLNYYRNFKISKGIFENLLNIVKLEVVKGVLLHEIGFNHGLVFELFSDCRKQIIIPDSMLGLQLFIKNKKKNNRNHYLIMSSFFKKEINNITSKELNFSKKDLSFRNKGIYKSSSMYYMKNAKKNNINLEYLDLETLCYIKPSIVYFSNCFTDTPNVGEFDKTNYFVDYYHFTLKLIEHCANQKIDLYIKLHPLSHEYPSESIFVKNIVEIVKKIKAKNTINIGFINPKTSLVKIKSKFNKSIFLTIRGSVISELLYSRMPTVYFADCNYSETANELRLTKLKILKPKFIVAYIKNFKKKSHTFSKLAIKTVAVQEKLKLNRICKKNKKNFNIYEEKISNYLPKINIINY
jgi:hypothetical protein